MMSPENILNLLRFVAEHDCDHDIGWNQDLGFYVHCSDIFWWATADAEDLTDETLEEYKQAVLDAKKASPDFGHIYGGYLYCSRQRKMRPQNPAYRPQYFLGQHPELVPLFNACGPERTDAECG